MTFVGPPLWLSTFLHCGLLGTSSVSSYGAWFRLFLGRHACPFISAQGRFPESGKKSVPFQLGQSTLCRQDGSLLALGAVAVVCLYTDLDNKLRQDGSHVCFYSRIMPLVSTSGTRPGT